MRKYWRIAIIAWQKALVWRLNTLLEILGYLATMLAAVALWRFAFFKSSEDVIAGYTAHQMMLYLLVAGWLTSSFWFTAQGDRIVREIKDGDFSNYLTKPLHIPVYYFINGNTSKIHQFILSTLAFLAALFAFDLHSYFLNGQLHVGHFALFFLMAWLIQWLIFYSAALLAFWMEEVWGVSFIIRVLADVAAGTFIPLSFFAPFWQGFFNLLPFKYIVSVPVNALLGRIDNAAILHEFAGAAVWLVILCLLAFIGMRRGLRHYSAVGG